MSNRQRVWKRSNEADTEEVPVSTSFFSLLLLYNYFDYFGQITNFAD